MSDENGRYVSTRELKDAIEKLRWEMRFLICAAVIASQVIPTADIAKTAAAVALGMLP